MKLQGFGQVQREASKVIISQKKKLIRNEYRSQKQNYMYIELPN